MPDTRLAAWCYCRPRGQPSRSEDWQRTVGCLPSCGQSKRVINCLLDGDEHDNSVRERLLEICQCAAEGISKAGGSPSEGQAVHLSDDNDGGIAGIAVEQPLLDTLLTQVNIVNVNQKLKQPLASSVAVVGLRQSRRHVGHRQRQRHIAHDGQDRRHPRQCRCNQRSRRAQPASPPSSGVSATHNPPASNPEAEPRGTAIS